MNDLFKKALQFVLKWEGGYVDNPNDKGGATNKGITQNTYNAWLKSNGKATKDVKNITQAEVEEIYRKNYWLASGCEKMTPKFASRLSPPLKAKCRKRSLKSSTFRTSSFFDFVYASALRSEKVSI